MIYMLIILLTLSFINICVVAKCMTVLNKRIDKLEPKIEILQYQTDDVLHDINIVNENVLNAYGMLGEMKDKNNNYE